MIPYQPRNEQVSPRQLFVLLFFTISPTTVLALPAMIGQYAGHDAWLAVALVTLAGAAVVRLHLALAHRFPGQGWTDIHRLVLGRWLGSVVNLLTWGWVLLTAAVIAREFGEFVVATVLPLTPLVVIQGTALGLAMWVARDGLEVLARVAELLFPVIAASFVFLLVLLLPNIDGRAILPLLESGWGNLLRGAVPPLAWLGETVLSLVIHPSLADWDGARRAGSAAVLVVGGLLTLLTLGTILVLGDTAALFTFPLFAATRTVSIADFIERLEPLLTTVWVGGLVIKMGVWIFAASITGAGAFGVDDYRPLVTPITALVLALSIWLFPSSLEMTDFLARTWPFLALLFQVVLPAAVLLLALVRGVGARGAGCPSPEPAGSRVGGASPSGAARPGGAPAGGR
ncbi:GerAB/ArcD/ProY family transporter [Thermaerobacter subterraneus]|uniref:Spore germination protein, amino acid permease n=1 Tax=Thermaerobacter subterraneus DSM 13965 TaxID=867903 RepID=K6P0W7_9FIRM|nr:endospore germination permease [Thermaerobacter subterraneus]EKP94750.1 spore germination protein, amino acid permease [Thermaerobacter subterraneus DSM 13965]